MATFATLTITADDITGIDFDDRRTSAFIEANTPDSVIVVDGTKFRIGGRRVTPTNGVITFADLVTTNTADNPASFSYRVTVVYTPPGAKQQETFTTGWFPLLASANLAAIPEAWDDITAPVLWRSEFRTEMEAIRDSTVDISNISTSDGVVEALVKNTAGAGPLTSTALADKYAARQNAQRDVGFGEPQHEDGAIYTYPNRLNFGPVNTAPPVAGSPGRKGVDIIAHWYNDFGLEHTAAPAGSTNGWYGWYDWQWNFPTNTGDGITTLGYDPQRHPLQGFYQGDDPEVLDWQAKWLAEGGVTAASIVAPAGVNTATWSTPSDKCYWAYQLFTAAESFKALRWLMWLKHSTNTSYLASRVPGDGTHPNEAQWTQMVNLYGQYQNGYTYTENGKVYPVLFMWDGEALRGSWDNYVGSTKTAAALKWLADQFKAAGYDGVMVAARGATPNSVMNRESLLHNGVIYVSAGYESNATGGPFADFAGYAANAVFPTGFDQVPAVQTSSYTVHPHPSSFSLPGSTPELFGLALRRAVDSVSKNKQRRMVFINNVSEWAESGPGLLPNVQDGFGYIDQVRELPPIAEGRSTYTAEGLYQRVISSGGATTSLTVSVPTWAKRISLRFVGGTNTTQFALMRINGDTAANYDNQTLRGQAATASAAETFAATSASIGPVSAGARRSMIEVSLDNHSGGEHRAWMAQGMSYGGVATGTLIRTSHGGGWRSGSPITSLTLLLASGVITDNSILDVYCWR